MATSSGERTSATLPAGNSAEETGIEVEIGEVCAVHSNFHNAASLTVGVWFYAERIAGELRASDDLDLGGLVPAI